jgi:hypothetical protein
MRHIAGQGFLRGTRIVPDERRRALRDHATRKQMKKAMKILLEASRLQCS